MSCVAVGAGEFQSINPSRTTSPSMSRNEDDDDDENRDDNDNNNNDGDTISSSNNENGIWLDLDFCARTQSTANQYFSSNVRERDRDENDEKCK